MHTRFQIFGMPAVEVEGKEQKLHSTKTVLLLAYLVLQPHKAHNRDTLAALLWEESPAKRAAQSLRQALYSIRQTINDNWLDVTPVSVAFRPGPGWWCDVHAFDAALAHNPPDYDVAIALYRGDVLEGTDID